MALDVDPRKAVLGFSGAALVLTALVYFVGVDSVLAAMADLDTTYVVAIAAVALTWLSCWGMSLRTVLRALDVKAGVGESVLLYASATFANNVTPFGQAGGEPVSALLISRATDTEYERGLAAIASVDALNFIPSIVLALLGLTYYVARVAVGRKVLYILGAVLVLALLVPLTGYLGWTNRERVQGVAVRLLSPLLNFVGEHVPRVTVPSRTAIRKRVASFFGSVERVAGSRRDLAVAVGFSLAGWLLMCVSLWLSLAALGHAVPWAAVFVAVPVATIASITPLPGGLGGVEATLVLVVVPITSVSAPVAASAALVYRGSTYWLPTILGGVAMAWLEAQTTR